MRNYLEKMINFTSNKRFQNQSTGNLDDFQQKVQLICPLLKSFHLQCKDYYLDAKTLELLISSLRNAQTINLIGNNIGAKIIKKICTCLRPCCSLKCNCPHRKCTFKMGTWIYGLSIDYTGITVDSIYELSELIKTLTLRNETNYNKEDRNRIIFNSNSKILAKARRSSSSDNNNNNNGIINNNNRDGKTMLFRKKTKPTIVSTVSSIGKIESSPLFPRNLKKHYNHNKAPNLFLPRDKQKLHLAIGKVERYGGLSKQSLKTKTTLMSPIRPKYNKNKNKKKATSSFRKRHIQQIPNSPRNNDNVICNASKAPISLIMNNSAKKPSSIMVKEVEEKQKQQQQQLYRQQGEQQQALVKQQPLVKQQKPLYLSLSHNPLSDLSISSICELCILNNSKGNLLHSLSLRGNIIGNDGANILGQTLESTGKNNGLTYLNVAACHIGRLGLSTLANAVSKTCVLSLDMSSNLSVHTSNNTLIGVNDKVGHSIATLISDSKSLTHLDISDNAFLPEELNDILSYTSIPWNSTLTSLNLSRVGLTAKSARTLALGLLSHKSGGNLLDLNISNNKLDARSLDDYASIVGHGNVPLEKLDISGNSMDDTTAKKFGKSLQARSCSSLRHLKMNAIDRAKELGYEQIKCDGFRELIEGAMEWKMLKKLEINGHYIRSSGAISFSQSINRTGLRYVDLRNNQIGERGAIAIAYACATSGTPVETPVGYQNCLKTLLLEGNPVEEKVLKYVEESILLSPSL